MKREYRYMIIKVKDAKKYLNELDGEQIDRILNKIAKGRDGDGKAPLECVVVENDWPEYEATWESIAARVDGANIDAISEYYSDRNNSGFAAEEGDR